MKRTIIVLALLMSIGAYAASSSTAASSSSSAVVKRERPAVLRPITQLEKHFHNKASLDYRGIQEGEKECEAVSFFAVRFSMARGEGADRFYRMKQSAQEGDLAKLMQYWPKAEKFDKEHGQFTTVLAAQYVIPCVKQKADWRVFSALASLIGGTEHHEVVWKKAQIGFKKETEWENEQERAVYTDIFNVRNGTGELGPVSLMLRYPDERSLAKRLVWELALERADRPARVREAERIMPGVIEAHQEMAALLK